MLQLQGFFIEADRPHQRLASMPCKQDFLHGLAFHVFLDELLEYLIRHDVILHVRIELTFLKVITILACQITNRTNRFQHDVDRLGERGNIGTIHGILLDITFLFQLELAKHDFLF